jgi:hypothetical protein
MINRMGWGISVKRIQAIQKILLILSTTAMEKYPKSDLK